VWLGGGGVRVGGEWVSVGGGGGGGRVGRDLGGVVGGWGGGGLVGRHRGWAWMGFRLVGSLGRSWAEGLLARGC